MRDVAQSAGVSIQTVSNLLNGRSHLMTPATRSRVEQAMRDLAYYPNPAAQTLRSDRTNVLAFLVLDEAARFLADPMTDLIIAGVGDVLRDETYGLLIQADRPSKGKSSLLKPLLERRVDGGFLFLSGTPSSRRRYVDQIIEIGTPFVVFEDARQTDVLTVTSNDRDGARDLTRHLLDKGHRRIAFVSGKSSTWPMIEERFRGYRDALEGAGIEPSPELEVFEGPWDASTGVQHAQHVMSLDDPPSAIMAANDLLALGAIRALHDLGRRIPEDVAVSGFDDFEFSAFLDPPLTSLRVPGYEMGRIAAHLLIDELRGASGSTRKVVLDVELRIREST
jgi:DNA-binding LacI/PurR family transcriptional regulator